MRQRLRPVSSIALATLLLAGCVQTTPRWDAAFGVALRAALAAQQADPAAARRPDSGAGLEGDAARAIHQRYLHEAAAPPAAPAPLQITGSAAK